jgi:hypothetical protein
MDSFLLVEFIRNYPGRAGVVSENGTASIVQKYGCLGIEPKVWETGYLSNQAIG